MKSLPWILAGGTIAVALYVLINQPGPQYAMGNDDIEDAARKSAKWGSRQRVSGAGTSLAGKVKEGFGNATGDEDLAGEGAADQAIGSVKDAVGAVANAAGQTLHELNR